MTDRDQWQLANQRWVTHALAALSATIERKLEARNGGGTKSTDEAPPVDLPEAHDAPANFVSALDRVARIFGLTPFERDLLLLTAGPELSTSLAVLISRALGDARRTRPTFSLALSLLDDAHWSAIAPMGPLRRWQLVNVGTTDVVTESPLRIDEAMLHYLAGLPYDDERTRSIFRRVAPTKHFISSSHREIAEKAVAHFEGARPCPVLRLFGPFLEEQRTVAVAASHSLGLALCTLKAQDIPASLEEREQLVRAWERESWLTESILSIEAQSLSDLERARVTSFVEALDTPVWILGEESIALGERLGARLAVPALPADEQRAIWVEALEGAPSDVVAEVDAVVGEFSLDAARIREIARRARSLSAGASRTSLWEEARRESCDRLGEMARRIEVRATFDDLVLPPAQLRALQDILVHARQRNTVFERWGFGRKSHRGLGLGVLFAGPSGTGKTMAAEVLASGLGLDLFHIDLSQVVSKYIGETEKNLKRVFDAAEGGGAILLFDEADSLFGKRSEVKDSHDRYANLEVSYLLQRMEAFRGLAVLTTNAKNSLDTAFLRRLRFIVQFPFPEEQQRAEIWRRTFPKDAPLDAAVDLEKLARLNVAGGTIRNIALGAAFLAAESGQPIGMSHLARSARTEFAKLEKPLPLADLGGFS